VTSPRLTLRYYGDPVLRQKAAPVAKVEPDPSGEPRCIRTVRNAGYMYVPDL